MEIDAYLETIDSLNYMYDFYEKNSNKIDSIENEKKNLINGGKGGLRSFFSCKGGMY